MNVDGTARRAIVWFRDDLRLADNPALHAARESGLPLLCVHVLDEATPPRPGSRALGGAARWWLYHALDALTQELAAAGASLALLAGDSARLIPALAESCGTAHVFWNRRYGAPEIEQDRTIKQTLRAAGHKADSFNGHLLYEPWTVKTGSGAPFRVFTPFWKAAHALGEPPRPLPAPQALKGAHWPEAAPARRPLKDLALLPAKPDWAGGLRASWQPGEAGGRARLAAFIDDGLSSYADERDRPDRDSISRLSPFLRFGNLSARTAFHAAMDAAEAGRIHRRHAENFVKELGWREFSWHLLFHNPGLATKNVQSRFDAFEWATPRPADLEAWQHGRTGYPVVDAGMRELWQTGFMHNRVRMIAASFLIKDMLVDWRVGEQWFWDTLCDADPANNPASWQWVAGTGADAAPYFRVFNPVLQGEKFDPEGNYVRRFVPELAGLPPKWIHRPWEAPAAVMKQAGVTLGRDYPAPILDHAKARNRALERFQMLKGS